MSANADTKSKTASPAGKVVIVLLVLLAAFLLTLPAAFVEKEPGEEPPLVAVPADLPSWEKALPNPGMSSAEATAAVLRARQLFEAAMRPALIDAGFGSEEDYPGYDLDLYYGYGWSDSDIPLSSWLTERLWNFRVFPELMRSLLTDLTDTAYSAEYRANRFIGMATCMAAVAEALAGDDPDAGYYFDAYDYEDDTLWLTYYTHDPRVFGVLAVDDEEYGYRDYPLTAGEGPEEEELFTAKSELARVFLATMLRDLRAEETARLEEARARGEDGTDDDYWSWDSSPPWLDDDTYVDAASYALLTLWEKRDNKDAYDSVLLLLTAESGSAADRYQAVPLALERPGLPPAEYAFWAKHRDEIDSMDRRMGPHPYYFGYIMGLCSDLEIMLHDGLASRGVAELAYTDGKPGIALREIETLLPLATKDPIYFLANTRGALAGAPDYDLGRALPVFGDTPLRFMQYQPLLLPLDPKRDDALIRWYLESGAAEGQLVLLAAPGTARDLAKHFGYLHFIWWPPTDRYKNTLPGEDPDVAVLNMGGGPFMGAILNNINGEAASRFLGPVSGIWFMEEGTDRDHWFEAKPGKDLPRILADENSPALYLTDPVNKEMTKHFVHSKTIKVARAVLEKYPARIIAGDSLDDIYTYMHEMREVAEDAGIADRQAQDKAIELFWRFRNDEAATRAIRRIFDDENISGWHKLEEARRAVGLTQEEL